jgi:hypothetical protein
MKRLLLSALFFFCSAPLARAYTDAGLKYTAGPDAYAGFSAFAEWGDDDYYLRPSVNSYASDLQDRRSTGFFGGGLDREAWSAGAELSLTPETAGYTNTSLYGDFTWNLLRAPAEDAALQDATLGVFAAYTAHEDAYSLSTTTVLGGRRASSSSRTDVFELGQTDYGLAASVKLYGLRASGRVTKTSYDKDISADSRQLPVDIGGIGTSGFPDTALSARLRAPGLPLSPEAGYTKTTYLLAQPDAESFSLGLSVGAGPALISASWENFNPGGGMARSDYYSLGVTVSF